MASYTETDIINCNKQYRRLEASKNNLSGYLLQLRNEDGIRWETKLTGPFATTLYVKGKNWRDLGMCEEFRVISNSNVSGDF